MAEKYVVTKTHNFDLETEATEFTDYRKATAYLHWLWEDYYNEALIMDSGVGEIDQIWCYHESEYAQVQWEDGDRTEFNLITIYPERKDFPTDWERYVTE